MKPNYKSTVHSCYLGYITQAIVNSLAPLFFVIFQKNFHLSLTLISQLVMLNFGTQLIVDAVSVKLVDRIGYRASALIAHVAAAAGLICMGTLPGILPSPFAGLVISVILYAIGGGLLEVIVSPIVESLPGDDKASAMSLLHSFYCWGVVGVVAISTLFLKAAGNDLWYILPICWALIPVYNFFRFLKVPLMPCVSENERTPLRSLLHSPVFLLALLLMFCAAGSEQSMSQWSSLFAEEGLHVPKLIGDLLGPCLFSVFMGLSRLIYGIYGERLNLSLALKGSAVLCIFCYLGAALSPFPLLSLASCALTGFSVGLLWPGTFSLTAATFPKGGTAMFGLMALMGDFGCGSGPWLTGLIADSSSLKTGLLFSIIFPIGMLAGVILMDRLARKERVSNKRPS
ncbi:MAG: MFS transporter [Candidatus Limivivens sp.]|nr:MFS transporter [Candidatus Limivivens sp.]